MSGPEAGGEATPPEPADDGHPHGHTPRALALLAFSALGVVFGDIGTSPIYSMREALHAHHTDVPQPEEVLGVVSLILWSLTLIVSIKYVIFVLRADNHGEGGILALTTLLNRFRPKHRRDLAILTALGLFGTALLYGDGMLTPAVSVLSAVEGLKTATPWFEPYVVPITVAILISLFSIQSQGTEGIGRLFSPVMLTWFIALAGLGLQHIAVEPTILRAISPHYGVLYLVSCGWSAFAVLGSVFLAVTGGEALYADLGHFGAPPIRRAWFVIVKPALILNYLGQGALLLHTPTAAHDPFFLMVPGWGIYPMVALTTLATVIASQALISGTFSLTAQAVQLKYIPRVAIEHTSPHQKGQIYVPAINWMLLIACVLLVVTFRSSSNLAAAYGVALTLDMVITTTFLYFVLRHGFGWSRLQAGPLCLFFLLIELVFFAGNVLKIPQGGWFPLAIGALIFMLMSTWRKGRQRYTMIRSEQSLPLEELLHDLPLAKVTRVPGTAVFMHADPTRVPPSLIHNLQHNRVLHTTNLICTVIVEDRPYVKGGHAASTEDLGAGFYRVLLRFGYMDSPDVPKALRHVVVGEKPLDPASCSYFLTRENILPRRWLWSGMSVWREKVFAFMLRNALDATTFFNIPPAQVMEVGAQIEI